MKKRAIYVLILLFLFICGCGNQQEQMQEIEPEFVLTYAENQAKDYPTTMGAFKFAKLVEEKTEGKIKIQVKYGGEFGTQQEVINQMQFGGVDFTRVSLSSISDELPQLNVLQLPFLYQNSEHMWEVLNGEIGLNFLELFAEIDLVGLSWYDAGARSFYFAGESIETLEDIKGKKIRVQESDMMKDMITLLGGIPVTVPYSDVYSAFETRKINAAENNWPAYEDKKHYEVAPYFIVDEHTRVPEVQLASGKTWEKLSKEYQDIILECAKESAEYEKQLWKERETLSRTIALQKGCKESILSETEMQKFKEITMPLYEKYCAEYANIIQKIQNSNEIN